MSLGCSSGQEEEARRHLYKFKIKRMIEIESPWVAVMWVVSY